MTDFYLGSKHNAAVWIDDPSEIPAAQERVMATFQAWAEAQGVRFSEVSIAVAEPGDKRLPAEPWPSERCLIGTAVVERTGLRKIANDDDDVIGSRTVEGTTHPIRSFYGDLSQQDRDRMIKATQQAYAELNPGKPPLSLEKCIAYIEALAPGRYEEELRHRVDSGLVN